MQPIKKVFYGQNKVGVLSNSVFKGEEVHWFIHVFLSLEGKLKLNISGEVIEASCIAIDYNTPHTFISEDVLHFSLFIGLLSTSADELRGKMNQAGYWVCENENIAYIQKESSLLLQKTSKVQYASFIEKLSTYLGITDKVKVYDSRIMDLIDYLKTCDCSNHAISLFAKEVALSPSRLAHLFKEETHVPLKSYIRIHQMKRAFEYLFEGSTITEAALNSGFDTPSHFASTVKKFSGMSATQLLKYSEFLKV